jgi:hypothetical protein
VIFRQAAEEYRAKRCIRKGASCSLHARCSQVTWLLERKRTQAETGDASLCFCQKPHSFLAFSSINLRKLAKTPFSHGAEARTMTGIRRPKPMPGRAAIPHINPYFFGEIRTNRGLQNTRLLRCSGSGLRLMPGMGKRDNVDGDGRFRRD